jgi:hypothetical protein
LNITNLEKEYTRTITALNRTGILTLLPRSENSGVIGIVSEELPESKSNVVGSYSKTNTERLIEPLDGPVALPECDRVCPVTAKTKHRRGQLPVAIMPGNKAERLASMWWSRGAIWTCFLYKSSLFRYILVLFTRDPVPLAAWWFREKVTERRDDSIRYSALFCD